MKKIIDFKIKSQFEVFGNINPKDLYNPEILKIKKNGEVFTDFGSTWAGRNRDEYDELGAIISAYVSDNDAIEASFVCDELIEYKKNVQSYTHAYGGKLVPDVVLTPSGEGDRASLVAISEHNRYYTNEDLEIFIVTNHNGEVLTDYENFFTTALVQDWEQKKFSYIKPELEQWLKENY